MNNHATLLFNDRKIELPVITGTAGEKAIDISLLRKETGLITLDQGYANTGACQSAITFVDGEKGILRYRGIPIEELAEKSTFVEVSYLLIYGKLPTLEELNTFRKRIGRYALIHEDMKNFFNQFHGEAHPMAILSSMVCSLSAYHPELLKPNLSQEDMDETITHLLSKVRVLSAFAYKRSIGQRFMYPHMKYDYIENFLYMMFATPIEDYEIDPTVKHALELLFILHADHEQNCSTSTVRMVGSARTNLFASISAGICALWGSLHGGANQAVIEMLQGIYDNGLDYKTVVNKAKDKSDPFKLMGFGHRVYKCYDPRAKIVKKAADDILNKLNHHDPVLDLAKELENVALKDDFFIERNLYPNVDFYSGIIYRAIGIPTNDFTVMFALGRLPGWIAHWKEMNEDNQTRICRPRQIYTGNIEKHYVQINER